MCVHVCISFPAAYVHQVWNLEQQQDVPCVAVPALQRTAGGEGMMKIRFPDKTSFSVSCDMIQFPAPIEASSASGMLNDLFQNLFSFKEMLMS